MTKYIDPSGNGDYLHLPQAIASAPSDLDWICRAGDVAPAGLNTVIPAGVSVRVDDAAKCNPLVDAGNSGFAYASGPVTLSGANITFKHLLLLGHFQFQATAANQNNITAEELQIIISGGSTLVQAINGLYSVSGWRFANNAIFFKDGTGFTRAFRAMASSIFGAATQSIEIVNNTIANVSTDQLDEGISLVSTGNHTLNAVLHNNVVMGAIADYAKSGANVNITGSHNASLDGTASSVLGGSGNLNNIVPTDWMTATDFTLLSGCPGIGAGDGVNGNNIGADQVTV